MAIMQSTREETAAAPASRPTPHCLYCAADDYEPHLENIRDRLGWVAGQWSFLRCRQCGAGMLTPHPRAEDLASFYPPVYTFTLDPKSAGRFARLRARLEYRLFFRPQYEAQARAVLRGIGWRRGQTLDLLDVGAGRGLRLSPFLRRGFRVSAMDFQPQAVEDLRSRLGVPAICTDIAGLTKHYAAGSLDVITAFHVVEHLSDVAAFFNAGWTLLRPGGWIVAAVPLVDCWQARLMKGRWAAVSDAPRHVSLPSQRSLQSVAHRCGFENVSVRPDSLINCAGALGLSLFPGAAVSAAYGGGRLAAVLKRIAGGAATVLATPAVWAENYLLRRPSAGIVFAQKPHTTASHQSEG